MKRTIIIDLTAFIVVLAICFSKPFAQEPPVQVRKTPGPFSSLTIIKLNEVSKKEDMDKVRETLRGFGYKVHSHKINFERKQVLIRMRNEIPTDSLILAFKNAGYTAWYDPKEPIHPQDAAYGGKK